MTKKNKETLVCHGHPARAPIYRDHLLLVPLPHEPEMLNEQTRELSEKMKKK